MTSGMENVMEKCCGKGCQNQGEPQEGFDFFVCDSCLEDLDRCLKRAVQQVNAVVDEAAKVNLDQMLGPQSLSIAANRIRALKI